MRNLFFVATAILLVFAFTSCKKDGQYKPEKRISKVYYSTSYYPEKRLDCTWTWDDKKLSRIDHLLGNGELFWSEVFTYDKKNRIEKVEDPESHEYVEYKYDGNKLAGLDYYYGENLLETATISYKKGKISCMSMVTYAYDYGITNQNAKFSLIPKDLKETILSKDNGIEYEIIVELVWDGDNISQCEALGFATDSEGNRDVYSAQYNYTYDDKINPVKGLWGLYSMTEAEEVYIIDVASFSKNNVTSMTYSVYTQMGEGPESYTSGRNYSFAYDGNYPTEIIVTDQGATHSTTTYYEYE